MVKKYALDIFDLLNRLNSDEGDIYSSLTVEERASFAPLVVMRWLSGSTDAAEILAVNEFINPNVFSLSKHPHLLMKLMQVCVNKKKKRYNWVAAAPSSRKSLSLMVMQESLGLSPREVHKIKHPPPAEILKMAEEIGWQQDEISKLKKELEKS